MIFHRHDFPEFWDVEINDKKAEVTFKRKCKKCKKTESCTMPLINVQPAWERWLRLKKNYKL